MNKQEAIKIVDSLLKKKILVRDMEHKEFKFNKNWRTWNVKSRSGKDRRMSRVDLETVFSFSDAIKKLEESPRRDMNIIGWYFSERKPDIRTKQQAVVALKRHLRAAKQLASFDDDQLVKGFKKAQDQTKEWVLETVVKVLSK